MFEGCSSGGGRFDLGMLYYMPQTWTSDNTDAICRAAIQYGTSYLFPPITMGAHVSGIPNHQVGRTTPLATRYAVAMSANLGYEMDLTQCEQEELIAIKEQVAWYKAIRETVQLGSFYRLQSPFEGNSCAWSFVSKDASHVILVYIRTLSLPAYSVERICCKGITANAIYRDKKSGQCFGGDELLYSGFSIPRVKADFTSYVWELEQVSLIADDTSTVSSAYKL